jgi:hypothetical protein
LTAGKGEDKHRYASRYAALAGRPYLCVIEQCSLLKNVIANIETDALQQLPASSRGDPSGLQSSGPLPPDPERIEILRN